ncbi:hypothetical protein C8R44DRAFT_754086 [Mycena epipterygia]|nr:hypothetical protein C8R44DRAFT_754086 [Mycena epipterygia]
MPLRRLSAHVSALFPSDPDFSHPLFTNITHLNLRYLSGSVWDLLSALMQIPLLTHLSFYNINTIAELPIYHGALLQCYATLAFDPRFMILVVTGFFWNCELGAPDDEELVAKRRSGETKMAKIFSVWIRVRTCDVDVNVGLWLLGAGSDLAQLPRMAHVFHNLPYEPDIMPNLGTYIFGMNTVMASRITVVDLVRTEVLSRFVGEGINWLDDRYAQGAVQHHGFVDPESDADRVAMAIFSLCRARFEEANTLYRVLAAERNESSRFLLSLLVRAAIPLLLIIRWAAVLERSLDSKQISTFVNTIKSIKSMPPRQTTRSVRPTMRPDLVLSPQMKQVGSKHPNPWPGAVEAQVFMQRTAGSRRGEQQFWAGGLKGGKHSHASDGSGGDAATKTAAELGRRCRHARRL